MSDFASEDPVHRLIGIGGGDQRHHYSFSDMLQQAERYPQFPLSQPDYSNMDVGPQEQRQTVALGIWLFHLDGMPLAVMQRDADQRYGRTSATLEVLTAHPETAAGFLARVRSHLRHHSVLKGQVVSLSVDNFNPSGPGVTFQERPQIQATDVILPPGVLERVAGHAVGMAAHRATLKALGQHLKRGILLYGPPGTGKTHTVRYLLAQSQGTTAIILTGASLSFVSEAAKMARALQPSIVVLEDCDLIAEDRSYSTGPQPLLFEVLDAMDGLDDDADVAFVLTTNRADLLEKALAQRPGRVDLAVEIPLPATGQRKALVELYGRDLEFSASAVAEVARRSSGTTASFARELVRRAVLAAAASGHNPSDEHLLAAVDDLMADGQALIRSLLGSGAEPQG